MIITKNFLQVLIQANEMSPFIAGQLFTFDAKTQKFQVLHKTKTINGFQVRWLLFMVISFTFLFRIMLRLSNANNHNMNTTVVALNVCIMMVVTTLLASDRYRIRGSYPEDFVSFFNGALEIEQKYNKGIGVEASVKSKLAKLVFRATYVFCKYIYSFGLAIACALDRSLPFNTVWALEYLIGFIACQNIYLNILINGALAMLNYMVWKMVAVQGYAMVADILVGVLSLEFCQEKAHRLVCRKLRWKQKNKMGEVDSAICSLREIHLLVDMCNDTLRSLVFFLLFSSGVSQAISVVALIRPEPFPFLVTLFFVAVTVQTVLINLVVYGFAGDVHKASIVSLIKLKQIIRKVHSGNFKREGKHFHLFLASCQPTKIKFGLSNFIEKNTPPIFQLFCVQRIIDVLLLF